jgi:hypothetical protein
MPIVMLFPKLEERINYASRALDNATSANIIELCQQYLALLADFRTELYKFPTRLVSISRQDLSYRKTSTTQERKSAWR